MVATCLLARACTEGRSPIRCRSRRCTLVISKPFYNRPTKPPYRDNHWTPCRLTLNRHNCSRDQRRRGSSSQSSTLRPDRHWQRSAPPTRTGTLAAPRPRGQSVPPTTGWKDASLPCKRGREPSPNPSRSEYCVRFHALSPHVARRKRRTHSAEHTPPI